MIYEIIKFLVITIFTYVAYYAIKNEKEKRYYEKQGVVFNRGAIIMDAINLIRQVIRDPYRIPIVPMLKKTLGVDHLPSFTGTMLFGMPCILISDPDALEDLYIKKNSAYTKHELEKKFLKPLVYNNIVGMQTDQPLYAPKRKVLSSAFFKNKVQKMVTMVKETVLEQFTILQAKGEKVEVNLTQYTQQVQAHIIMNILCGHGQSTKELDYCGPGMKIEKVQLADYMEKIFRDMMKRIKRIPLALLIPSLMTKQLTEQDKRFDLNCKTLRNFIQGLIIERQQKEMKDDDAIDMISILVQDEIYGKQHDDIIDDVITMFVAGSKTVQTTTTNFITHMLHRPDLKEKLDAEINPMLERCEANFMELMTTEEVDELAYLKMIYSEVLRYDTPFSLSKTSCFSKDVNINGVNFKKGTAIFLSLSEMHRSEKEWIEPHTFNPDRFNPNSKYFKRADGSNRNPLAFNPFLGGKRICLGKTFAETTLKFTLPLFYHHFDFEFVKEEHKKVRPHYEIGGQKIIDIPVNFITKNKVKQNFRGMQAEEQVPETTTSTTEEN